MRIPYRPIMSAIAAVGMMILAGVLSYNELSVDEDGQNGIPPDIERVEDLVLVTDALLDIQYTAQDREKNLAAFGLPEPMIRDAVRKMNDYERNSHGRIVDLFESAPDVDTLILAFCSKRSTRRPRYEALHFLVDDKSGDRRAVDLQRTSMLNVQEWSELAAITRVYETLELNRAEQRRDDATLMGLAAILLGQEELALEGDRPWGRGARVWSWEEVHKKWPTIDRRIVEYVALMHVFAEVAWEEGGLCQG